MGEYIRMVDRTRGPEELLTGGLVIGKEWKDVKEGVG
jgi:hypothetical protein